MVLANLNKSDAKQPFGLSKSSNYGANSDKGSNKIFCPNDYKI